MIVSVTKENLNLWAKLCDELWSDTEEYYLSEWESGNLKDEFLYFADGDAVAFISLSLRNDYVEGTDSSPVGYLEGIYVKPEYRNRGIAREMVTFAKKWAVDKGCSEFASDCLLENEESRIFHKKIGFEEANIIVCFTMDLV